MDLEILKIASNTENNKIVEKYTHTSKQKNSVCGDEMEISLIINKNIIIDFGYQCKSCIYCQASVSLLSRKSINESKDSLTNLIKISDDFFDKKNLNFPRKWQIFKKLFNKKNLSRKECIKLPFKTLSSALNN
tara:strand:+ start:748 stop:1146 length:399 start_codon:yes stop_codon:yes gene_type:complete